MDGLVVVGQVSRVSALVHLFLHLGHAAQVVEISRVFHRLAIGGVGEVGQYELAPALCLGVLTLAHGHQIHVVIHVEAVDVVGIPVEQSGELPAGGGVVLELVLENDAHVVEALLNHVVGGLDLLGSLGNLLEVVFGLVGVVLRVELLFLSLLLLGGERGVVLGRELAVFLVIVRLVERECGLVAAAPVVFELSRAPAALELGLALVLGHGVVEIPRLVGVGHEVSGGSLVFLDVFLAFTLLLSQVFGTLGLIGLFLLLLYQLLGETLGHLHLLFGGHGGEGEQRVLQLDVSGIECEFVEHVAAAFQHLVVGVGLGQLGHGLRIARLGLDIFSLLEIEVSEGELREGLVDAVAGRFLDSGAIVLEGLHSVVAREVEIAYGVVNLVEKLLVAGITGHGAQRAHLTLDVGALEDLRALDAGVELGAVVGRGPCAGLLEGLVCAAFLTEVRVQLAEQEPEAVLLTAVGVSYGLREERQGLPVLVGAHVIVALGEVVEVFEVLVGEVFLLDEMHGVLGLVGPVEGAVRERHPQAGLGDDVGQPLEMLGDVEESGRGAREVAVIILRLAHREPRIVQEWVELVACPECLLLGRRALLAGLLLDGMQLD